MTTYNTGNPVGSVDPKDLYDNAQNLDNIVNGSEHSYADRLGVARRSLAGIDAAADAVLSGLGYAPPVTYAAGISLTLTTQTVEYNGEVYAPKLSALPFTTGGTFDPAKFRVIQGVLTADLAAPGGSALVGFQQSGAGAVARTIQDKLRESVSVKDFGAVGDGVANDTAAIQLALAALGNTGALYFPAGVYSTDPIDLRACRNIVLKGASDASEYPYDIDGMTVIRIRSAGDVGIKTATPGVNSYTNPTTLVGTIENILLDCMGNVTTGINCARGIRIQGCTVQGAIQDGIVFEVGTFPVWIDHVMSRNNGRDGIRVQPSFTTLYSITNTECSYNAGNGFSIYDGSTCNFQGCTAQSNGGDGFLFELFDPAGYAHPIFLERLSLNNCYTEANTGWGIRTNSYNTNPASYVGKIAQLAFTNCSFNSGTGQNAQLRGLMAVTIVGSFYLSDALDPLYNTVSIDDFTIEGSVKPKYKLDLSLPTSGQIVFPATQNPSTNPNTLDDYEEGDWTARISQSQTNYFTTSGTTSAKYQKIGNTVHCFVTYTWSDKGTADGAFRAIVDDLPYIALGGAYIQAAVGCSIQVAGGSTDDWSIWPQAGTKTAVLIKNNTAGEGALVSDLPAAGTLTAQFSYLAT